MPLPLSLSLPHKRFRVAFTATNEIENDFHLNIPPSLHMSQLFLYIEVDFEAIIQLENLLRNAN